MFSFVVVVLRTFLVYVITSYVVLLIPQVLLTVHSVVLNTVLSVQRQLRSNNCFRKIYKAEVQRPVMVDAPRLIKED